MANIARGMLLAWTSFRTASESFSLFTMSSASFGRMAARLVMCPDRTGQSA